MPMRPMPQVRRTRTENPVTEGGSEGRGRLHAERQRASKYKEWRLVVLVFVVIIRYAHPVAICYKSPPQQILLKKDEGRKPRLMRPFPYLLSLQVTAAVGRDFSTERQRDDELGKCVLFGNVWRWLASQIFLARCEGIY